MKIKTYIISHIADLDGLMSGQIASEYLAGHNREIICIPHDYRFCHDDLMRKIAKDSDVYILDLSLPKKMMIELNESCNLIWIDHHKSAIEEMADEQIGGIREVGKAACELAWEYFFPEEKMPLSVFLLGKYDTWRKQDENHFDNDKITWDQALNFQYFCKYKTKEIYPDFFLSSILGYSSASTLASATQGHSLLSFNKRKSGSHSRAYSFERNHEGIRLICINSNERNSIALEENYDPDAHDIMCCYFYDGNNWIHSFYSDKENIDCSAFAKKLNKSGGGHKGAAGCELASPAFY